MDLKKILVKAKNFFLDLLFPIRCHVYGEEGLWLCQSCFRKIPLIKQDKCPLCLKASQKGFLCFSCLKRNPLERILLASDYRNSVLKETIHIFKYESIRDLAEPLGVLLVETLHRDNLDFNTSTLDFIIIPIPLHKSRLRERGFNQAELLAKVVGEKLKLKTVNILERKKFLLPQTDLKDSRKRRENVRGVFSLNPDKSLRNLIRYSHLILVDDVITTGATIQEAARILKKAGAQKIWALALARG
jgi:ComF family protein